MKLETQKKSSYSKNSYLLYGKGYTLIEILVAVGIFSIAIAIATSFFVSSLKSQNRALNIRETIDNASHVMEYVSRALRMARKDKDGNCISAGTNYEITRGGEGIKFDNYKEPSVCQEFYRDTDPVTSVERLYESRDGAAGVPLTSDDLEVTQFQFQLSGEDQIDNFQPRVTMLFEIAKKGGTGLPKIRTQTTVSQRNLDIMR